MWRVPSKRLAQQPEVGSKRARAVPPANIAAGRGETARQAAAGPNCFFSDDSADSSPLFPHTGATLSPDPGAQPTPSAAASAAAHHQPAVCVPRRAPGVPAPSSSLAGAACHPGPPPRGARLRMRQPSTWPSPAGRQGHCQLNPCGADEGDLLCLNIEIEGTTELTQDPIVHFSDEDLSQGRPCPPGSSHPKPPAGRAVPPPQRGGRGPAP
eukprot:EG_transcript_29335